MNYLVTIKAVQEKTLMRVRGVENLLAMVHPIMILRKIMME